MVQRKASHALRRPKKPVRLTADEAIERFDRMMPLIGRNVVSALRIMAVLKASNDAVAEMGGKEFPGADTHDAIVQSLSFDLALHLARLFDRGTKNRHVNKRDVASIPLMIRLLRQKRCQATILKRSRFWSGYPQEMGHTFEGDCAQAIAASLSAYGNIRHDRYARSAIRRLKPFRDKFMAHSLMGNFPQNPIYNQLFALTACARDIVDAAGFAFLGQPMPLNDRENAFRVEAERFWRKALLGQEEE